MGKTQAQKDAITRWRLNNPEKWNEYQRKAAKKWRLKLKVEVLGHYGSECACCGESDIRFLTLDHVDGGGTEHRRSIGGGGTAMYREIRRLEFPDGYQVLCFNCNQGRHINGGICPHQEAIMKYGVRVLS